VNRAEPQRVRAGRFPRYGVAAVLLAVLLLFGQPLHGADDDTLEGILEASPKCVDTIEHCFAIELFIVVKDGEPVQTAEWVTGQVETANAHFEPIGVAFELASVQALDAGLATITERSERDMLGRGAFRTGVVQVYVVEHLANVDEEGEIYGVHWRDREKRSRRWLILSSLSWNTTLAHELGHFFGQKHSDYPISIMNKTARSEPPVAQRTFADEELTSMRKVLAKMLKKKQLVDRR